MDFKPKPGSFLPFLESAQREKRTLSASVPASPMSLMEILSRQSSHSMAVFDLQSLSGMDPSRYAEALKGLLDGGYIAITGDTPQQSVGLTDKGADTVRLARPA